jgi:hypothetical protein
MNAQAPDMITATADRPEGGSGIEHAGEALDQIRAALARLQGRRPGSIWIDYSLVRDEGFSAPDERTRAFDLGVIEPGRGEFAGCTIKAIAGGHYELDATAGPDRLPAFPGGRGSQAWAWLHGDSSPDEVAQWLRSALR